MILDKREHLTQYAFVGYDAKAVEAFIQKAERENLPQGRYDLEGERLFAMIQEYETKEREECLYEAHKLYGDIQYMVSGTESIYGAHIDGLHMVEDRTPEADILFYDRAAEEAMLILKPGMFAIFLPQDGHMPCCRHECRKQVRKIVVKFRL